MPTRTTATATWDGCDAYTARSSAFLNEESSIRSAFDVGSPSVITRMEAISGITPFRLSRPSLISAFTFAFRISDQRSYEL